jgi:phage tail sheath protein FI
MAQNTYLNRSTPNVYITEIPAFGTSIIGVPTAVPIFIGYTEFAGDPVSGESLYNKPVQISSMTEFQNYFGGAAPQNFVIAPVPRAQPPASGGVGTPAVIPTPDLVANYTTPSTGSSPPPGGGYSVAPTGFVLQSTALEGEPNQFNLYWQMRLFFSNGGGNCYVVSAGCYWSNPPSPPISTPDPAVSATWFMGSIAASALTAGIDAAAYAKGPTMIVVPEACQLGLSDYGTVVQRMLLQASTLQDRVAILDLPDCMTANNLDALTAAQNNLWTQIAPQIVSASYGAAYAPALNTSIVTINDILYTNLLSGDNSVINNILTTQAWMLYKDAKGNATAQTIAVQNAIAAAFPLTGANAGTNTKQFSGTPGEPGVVGSYTVPTTPAQQRSLDNLLVTALPVFGQIEQQIANTMNVAPPSGILAGVWNKSDVQSGVWNAPANIALAGVVSPLYNMSDSEQGDFNLPTNGQAIDIIRAQPSRGNVVWGARTLDGNSNDYRYIQVRRTLIYVEQSIKLALQTYVFAANDAITWTNVTASISSFLTGLWQQGGLMGAKPSEAFTVNCGLGSTMTAQDVLGGYMVVAVTLQMIHPAEFIELTFTQTMGS